eukprot:NODE_588_length_2070_cov_30.181098_g542_i0.p1 GENE.NODE_588_length_2070_cov_30.181098_g542_i0~~NODE_588_length_2070_cov_30.181098_g542_i0.p1  ORF type:complete len:549 (+),score=66.82 NODE_588_length_2070_cov_30.181098_g542_i0:66-1649(+)
MAQQRMELIERSLVRLSPQTRGYVKFIVAICQEDGCTYSLGISCILDSRGARSLLRKLEHQREHQHKRSLYGVLCGSVVSGVRCDLGLECPCVHVTAQGYKNRRVWSRPIRPACPGDLNSGSDDSNEDDLIAGRAGHSMSPPVLNPMPTMPNPSSFASSYILAQHGSIPNFVGPAQVGVPLGAGVTSKHCHPVQSVPTAGLQIGEHINSLTARELPSSRSSEGGLPSGATPKQRRKSEDFAHSSHGRQLAARDLEFPSQLCMPPATTELESPHLREQSFLSASHGVPSRPRALKPLRLSRSVDGISPTPSPCHKGSCRPLGMTAVATTPSLRVHSPYSAHWDLPDDSEEGIEHAEVTVSVLERWREESDRAGPYSSPGVAAARQEQQRLVTSWLTSGYSLRSPMYSPASPPAISNPWVLGSPINSCEPCASSVVDGKSANHDCGYSEMVTPQQQPTADAALYHPQRYTKWTAPTIGCVRSAVSPVQTVSQIEKDRCITHSSQSKSLPSAAVVPIPLPSELSSSPASQ